MSSSSSSLQEIYNEQGFVIVNNVISPEICALLCQKTLDRIVQIIFGNSSVDPAIFASITFEELIHMFTDEKLRVAKLGPVGAKIMYRKGNSRQPLLSKSTGMTDQHYIPEVLENIAFNKNLYEIACQLYGQTDMVFAAGIERFCFKSPGATVMDKHIDRSLFDSKLNYYNANGEMMPRVQCVVTAAVDPLTDPDNSGGLCLLRNFHHYTRFAEIIFHPHTGIMPFPDTPGVWSRFFILPKDFDRIYLPQFERLIQIYMAWVNNPTIEIPSAVSEIFIRCQQAGIKLPTEYKPISWYSVEVKPGDAVFWNYELPHFSRANKSHTARIAFYYSVFPAGPNWFGSSINKWLIDQILELRYSYGVQGNKFPVKAVNPEEQEYLAKHPEEIAKISQLIMSSELNRRLCGLMSW